MRLGDVFKIGIGPSSSHTVGPMRAAERFITLLAERQTAVARIRVDLFGSLALTGRGHGTDRALIFGLSGYAPDRIEPDVIAALPAQVAAQCSLRLPCGVEIAFDPAGDIVFNSGTTLPHHPNGMRFTAYEADGNALKAAEYFSIGGGAVEGEGFESLRRSEDVPYPFTSAEELLAIAAANELKIWEIVQANELAFQPGEELQRELAAIWRTMDESAERGLHTEGILPGGLNVRRRAPRLYAKYKARAENQGLEAMDYLNVVAIAVNEENAAGGRVVTAPTNGAAGIIPAVIRYYRDYIADADAAGIERCLLAAAAVGMLYKRNASISGAEVGCQGEVGVACSMGAAGLVAAMNGTNAQMEHAAEIAMEHNLGMTCDPIGGLVQIPCIERNAIGAVKAINAVRMAMGEDEHKVSLDQVIAVMYQTGLDMQSKYKETSLGGLAVNVVEC
jgi:L-serine dehydratase